MRGRSRGVVVARPRLVDECRDARVVLLEAAGGFGKSVVCEQVVAAAGSVGVRVQVEDGADAVGLIAQLAQVLRRYGLTDLALALTGADPLERFLQRLRDRDARMVVVVDEVHRGAPSARSWLADLAQALPDGVQLLVAGRRIGKQLDALPESVAMRLSDDDLAFDAEETAAYLTAALGRPPTPAESLAVAELAEGWPAAVALAAGRLMVGALPEPAVPAGSVLPTLVSALVQDADPLTRALLGQLARLPLLSAKLAASVGGPGAMDRMLDLGIPLHFEADGWARMADPVRDALEPLGQLSRESAVAAANWYAANGELVQACLLLRREADHEALAALLCSQSRRDLEGAGLPLLHALMESLPDHVLARHLDLMRTAVVSAEQLASEHRRPWLERALRLAPPEGPQRRALLAERSLMLARDGSLSEAVSLATDVVDTSKPEEVLTRARAHFSRGLAVLVQSNAHEMAVVRTDLEAAIGLLQLAGEPQLESYLHVVLGYGVHHEQGAAEAARDSLALALALLSAPDLQRGMCLTYVADTSSFAGDLDRAEAAVREATAIGARLGAEDVLGYAAWSQAEVAAQRRDAVAALAALVNAERHGGTWFDRHAGISFLGQAAQICLLVGDLAAGLVYLERAEGRVTADGDELAYAPAARLRYEAVHGDPYKAPALVEKLEVIGLPRDGWLVLLLGAVAAHRRGEASDLLARSRARAEEAGDPARLERREPELLAVLGESVATGTATRVLLLGQFRVLDGSTDRTPPPGRPATLVKLVALRGTVTVDEAVDVLWPEVDLDTGRGRLRNLLHRVRASSGDVVERREDALVLGHDHEVDAVRFARLTAEALAAPLERRAGQARSALSLHTGGLLPADQFADWVIAPRERLQRQRLSLLDIVAADALRRGDLDEAIGVLDEAITAEPLGMDRYVQLARSLVTQGRVAAARAVAQRGLAVADDLGIPGEPELEAQLA